MNKTASKKRRRAKKIVSKLSDIAKYLEEAGMAGAKELRSAMSAIDGNFADDCISDSIVESIPDSQRTSPGMIPGMLHGGQGGRPSLFDGQAPMVASEIISSLEKIANKLDELGHYDEADYVDDILQDLLNDNMPEIIEDLEKKENVKKTKKVDQKEKDKAGTEAVVRSNGLVPYSTNQNSGFSGFSDSYFYSSYENLEGEYGPSR